MSTFVSILVLVFIGIITWQGYNTREIKEGRKSQKEWKDLQAWKKARADGSEPTIWDLQKRQDRDRDLVFRHLNGRGSAHQRDVLEAGHRILPTGRWACLNCGSRWTARGPVPAQWWTPANNAFTPMELKAMPDPPAWQCRSLRPGPIGPDGKPIQCGVFSKVVPVPNPASD